ncbi:MAG: hypothetical protein CM1200mP20_12370 [Pseudomonadota bacterium]|nr:MAG: hypothetical protein CM1200mP20_12370 [Pseudomonadota bacterium]
MTGIIILTYRRDGPSSWPIWALGLPISAAVLRALAHALTKLGFNEVPEPLSPAWSAIRFHFALH